MKKYCFLFLLGSLLPGISGAQTGTTPKEEKAKEKITWMSLNQATELNKTSPKKIYMDVYTDWCGWCKKMDATTFEDPEVVAVMNRYYYAVKFNAEGKDTLVYNGKSYISMNPAPGRATHKLAVELLEGKLGYPTSVYFDKDIKKIQSIPGYMDAKMLKQVLEYFGEDYNKTIAWDDFVANYDDLMKKKDGKEKEGKKKKK